MPLPQGLGAFGLLGALAPLAGCVAASLADADADAAAEIRRRMVREQLAHPARGIVHPGVLKAMTKVPRHAFVPPALRAMAYEDRPLPIGHGQTISQPFIVALMTQTLDPQPDDRVLEIGTGSGYQAAVLAELVREVYTMEIVEPLAERAGRTLRGLGCTNVFTRTGDGYQGWPEAAPFDRVIVTCAPDHIPEPLVRQLRDGGRMMIPVGEQGGLQELVLLIRQDGRLETQSVLPVVFVPMTGQAREQR